MMWKEIVNPNCMRASVKASNPDMIVSRQAAGPFQ
jgi:hypothetical protein